MPGSFHELIAAQVAQSLQTGIFSGLLDASLDLLPVGDGGVRDNGAEIALGWAEFTLWLNLGQPAKMPYARNGQQALTWDGWLGRLVYSSWKRNFGQQSKHWEEWFVLAVEDGVMKILVGVEVRAR